MINHFGFKGNERLENLKKNSKDEIRKKIISTGKYYLTSNKRFINDNKKEKSFKSLISQKKEHLEILLAKGDNSNKKNLNTSNLINSQDKHSDKLNALDNRVIKQKFIKRVSEI